ncbi:MAG: hypothetical protein R2705_13155 [Ilumatobacteraceae bacterium]
MRDTRYSGMGASGKLAADTPVQLRSGVVSFTMSGMEAAGTADVYPCGGAPAGDPTVVFKAETYHARAVVSDPSAPPLCLVSTQPFHLIEDVLGSVATTPFAGGLQYRALATPQRIYEDAPDAGTTTTLPRGAVPSTASGATYLIEAIDPSEQGFVQAWGCDQGRPEMALLVHGTTRVSAIVNASFGSASSLCILSFRSTRIRVTLLGYLTPTGPDPTALPPTLVSQQGQLDAPGLRPISPVRVLDTRPSESPSPTRHASWTC